MNSHHSLTELAAEEIDRQDDGWGPGIRGERGHSSVSDGGTIAGIRYSTGTYPVLSSDDDETYCLSVVLRDARRA